MMRHVSLFVEFPLVEEVACQYILLRRSGQSRNSSIEEIKNEYSLEIADEDEAPCVYMGLALALLSKKELLDDIARKAADYIDHFCQYDFWSESNRLKLAHLKFDLLDSENIGYEAKYVKRSYFRPDWKVGDTFAHTLRSRNANALGIKGHTILMRKVGEYKNSQGEYCQLMYITVCSPDKLPSSVDDINSLGFLPMLPVSRTHFDYLAKIIIGRRSDETKLELTKIGCFPDAGCPENQAPTDYRTCMNIFHLKDKDGVPHYESIVCSSYKRFGITTAVNTKSVPHNLPQILEEYKRD